MLKLTTRVKKADIIESLKRQLDEHTLAHKEAKKKWQEKMLAVAEQIVKASGKLKKYPRALEDLQFMPRSYAVELQAFIRRFELDMNETIELSTDDYEILMEGRWYWRHEFNSMNSRYGSTGCTGSTGSTGSTGCVGGNEEEAVTDEIEAVLGEDELEA